MSDTIIAVLITGAVTLAGTVISTRAASNKTQAIMDMKMENMAREIAEIKEDVREHNHYAKLFSETVPVMQERISVANHRISDLEDQVGKR